MKGLTGIANKYILSKVKIIFERHMVGSSKLKFLCADGKLRSQKIVFFRDRNTPLQVNC